MPYFAVYALADLPDQQGWRINPAADYGPLNTFARGKIDRAPAAGAARSRPSPALT